jgi:hypothetical protein
MLGAFAAAVRDTRFSRPAYCQLAVGAVTDSVNHVASAFMDAGLLDPETPLPPPLLAFYTAGASTRATATSRKNLKQQKAIPASILLDMPSHAQLPFSSAIARAVADIAIGAFFFAMCSCEYVHVTGMRRTKPLHLRNLRFFRNNKAMALDDPNLSLPTTILITFEFQKATPKTKLCTSPQPASSSFAPSSGGPPLSSLFWDTLVANRKALSAPSSRRTYGSSSPHGSWDPSFKRPQSKLAKMC